MVPGGEVRRQMEAYRFKAQPTIERHGQWLSFEELETSPAQTLRRAAKVVHRCKQSLCVMA